MKDFTEQARKLVGERRAELEQWAHDAKIMLVANALLHAYMEGVSVGLEKAACMVDACTDRDPTLRKLSEALRDPSKLN